MSNDLIDEEAYTKAIQPFDFREGTIHDAGSQAWTRQFLLGYVANIEPDTHLKNMVQRVREYLQINQPVMAYQWIDKIKDYLEERGDI